MDEYVLKKLELIKAKWKEKNDFQEKGVILLPKIISINNVYYFAYPILSKNENSEYELQNWIYQELKKLVLKYSLKNSDDYIGKVNFDEEMINNTLDNKDISKEFQNLYKYITAIVTNKENKEIEQGKLDKLIEKYNKNLHDNLNEENELKSKLIDLFKKEKEYKFKKAKEAEIESVLKNIPALIIINEDGIKEDIIELCNKIRKKEDNSITPIIVISSVKEKEHRIQVLKACVEHYIKAPIDEQYLYYTVKNVIRLLDTNRRVSPLTGLPGNVQIQTEIKRIRLLKYIH